MKKTYYKVKKNQKNEKEDEILNADVTPNNKGTSSIFDKS
jgi:hypothetical protein